MSTVRKLVWLYVALGCLTFLFQIWWRASYCGDCTLSFIKGAVWSSHGLYIGSFFLGDFSDMPGRHRKRPAISARLPS
jgi:hypothetical protein